MNSEKVERLYGILDQSTSYISKQWNKPYSEALIDAGESIFEGEIVLDGAEHHRKKLRTFFQGVQLSDWLPEERRRAFQYAVLKALQQDGAPRVSMTPDSVVLFVSFLIRLWVRPDTVADPAIGSANLMTGILNTLYVDPVNDSEKKEIQAYGTEVEPTMIRFAYVNANLQGHHIELTHQDSMKSMPKQAELVVSELPVGIYPQADAVQDYKLYAPDKPLYTHHLLFEQAIRSVLPAGFVFLIVPSSLFTENGADQLRNWMTKQTYIHAYLQLPQALFQTDRFSKSILVLQKKSAQSKPPEQALMANIPDIRNEQSMIAVIKQIRQWLSENGKTLP